MAGDRTGETAGGVDPDTVDDLRRVARGLAKSGGAVARGMLADLGTSPLRARTKSSATDPVTEIDTTVEEHLRAEISRLRPGDRVLGEEGGEAGPAHTGPAGAASDRGGRVRWVVDPVDGTVNLLYGIPFTAVSVAAELDGEVVAGAVHNIVTGETWTAGAGRGATLEDAEGQESTLATSGCAELGAALVGTGFAYDAQMRAEQGAVVGALLPRIRDIRRCGSAALDLCMLASGRLDAYFERGLQYWDHAAGALVAAEAGAVVAVSHDPAVPTTAAAPGVSEEFLSALGAAGAAGGVSS